jgi:hypothetical protein
MCKTVKIGNNSYTLTTTDARNLIIRFLTTIGVDADEEVLGRETMLQLEARMSWIPSMKITDSAIKAKLENKFKQHELLHLIASFGWVPTSGKSKVRLLIFFSTSALVFFFPNIIISFIFLQPVLVDLILEFEPA